MDDFNEGLILPSLIKQLKSILDQYPDNGQILKEMIQNAEDAGANKIVFLIDRCSYGTDPKKLCHPGLAEYQGPALYVYNDAKFSPEDWKGIRMVNESIKQFDPMKVGRFGLGFKSVFHMTDLPSVLSGEAIAFIDPHMQFFHKDASDETSPRTSTHLWHLIKDRDVIKQLSHQFDPFIQDLFGVTWKTLTTDGQFSGTLFRFPLRTTDIVSRLSPEEKETRLSTTVYGDDKLQELVRALTEDGKHLFLFLRHLESIEVFKKCDEVYEKMNPAAAASLLNRLSKYGMKLDQVEAANALSDYFTDRKSGV